MSAPKEYTDGYELGVKVGYGVGAAAERARLRAVCGPQRLMEVASKTEEFCVRDVKSTRVCDSCKETVAMVRALAAALREPALATQEPKP